MDLTLASRPEAPSQAREAVQPLRGRVDDSTLEDLRLVISELVTNAVMHSPGRAIDVSVEVDEEGVIRGRISDGGDGAIGLRPVSAERPGGYGLRIVDALTDRWGVERNGVGVWFELTGTAPAP